MIGRLKTDHRGGALIEMVIVTPVLILLMLALFDLGNLMQQKIWLQQAVRAGGILALGQPENQAIIDRAVTAAGGKGVTATAVATCGDATCTSAAPLPIFVTITASSSFSALILPITTVSARYVEQVH